MRGPRLMLVLLVSGCLVNVALAAGLFSRKAKASPQRAQELVSILKSDAKERNRANAADELGTYDPQTNPEIVPALLEAVHDASADVRLQVIQALGKLRPVRPEVGQALEQLTNSDGSTKVRLQARTILWQYQLAGYRAPKGDSPPAKPTTAAKPVASPAGPTSQEPPLLEPLPQQAAPLPVPASRLAPIPAPLSKGAPAATTSFGRPLPKAPSVEDGPELNAPK